MILGGGWIWMDDCFFNCDAQVAAMFHRFVSLPLLQLLLAVAAIL